METITCVFYHHKMVMYMLLPQNRHASCKSCHNLIKKHVFESDESYKSYQYSKGKPHKTV